MAGYLFVHFTGEQQYGEQIYFSISRDGLHWKDLNGHRPVLYSDIGEKGARDSFCVRDEKNGKFYLFATDLRIEEGKGWETAIFRGSRDMIVWESEDLVHWSEARAVTVGRENAGSVWAPEAVYVPEKEAFLVFWASHINTPDGKGGKFQIDCAWTKDFVDFTAPEKFMEREKDVIDTTMIQAEGRWYRFTMNDVTKRVCMEWASDPKGPYEEIKSETLTKLSGVEGPEIYRLPDGRYCLIADRFMTDGGYLPLVSADLAGGKFEILTESAYDMGSTKKRHGGILPITDEEYERLEKNFDRTIRFFRAFLQIRISPFLTGSITFIPRVTAMTTGAEAGFMSFPQRMASILRKGRCFWMWRRSRFPGPPVMPGLPVLPEKEIPGISISVLKTRTGNPVSEWPGRSTRRGLLQPVKSPLSRCLWRENGDLRWAMAVRPSIPRFIRRERSSTFSSEMVIRPSESSMRRWMAWFRNHTES